MAHSTVLAKDLSAFRLLDRLKSLLERLHLCGTARDRAHNRTLHFDQYTLMLLLYFFNPVITSMRGLQQVSGLEKVQKRLGVGRFSLGSFSEAAGVFDPELLRQVLGELASKAIPIVTGREAQALKDLTAVDGSLLPALPKMAWALWQDEQHRAAKMHVMFDVFRCVPIDVTITAGNACEKTQFRGMLQPGLLYVIDRGYGEYALFQEIVDAKASFIGRIREDAVYRVVETRPLSAADKKAGVIEDVIIDKLGSDHHKNPLKQKLRIVKVATGKTNADGSPNVLVLATNRMDLPAELIALGYKFRWSIELFFRWTKCILGCRHLLSNRPEGVAIQIYCALIVSIMLAIWTGRKPNKRTYEMLCHYFAGLASEEELLRHLETQRA